MVFIMFTGYMFGYALVRSQIPDSPAMVSVFTLTDDDFMFKWNLCIRSSPGGFVNSLFCRTCTQHAAGGVFGLIVGMFVETILFITRVSMTEKRSEMKEKVKLKAEQSVLQSSAEPALPLSAETPSLSSEIQPESEVEMPFGIRKRRAPVQSPD